MASLPCTPRGLKLKGQLTMPLGTTHAVCGDLGMVHQITSMTSLAEHHGHLPARLGMVTGGHRKKKLRQLFFVPPSPIRG